MQFWKPKEHLLHATLWVPAPIDRIFPFFADAGNLNQLTPSTLGFQILTPAPLVMREGLLIDYKISLHGLPMRWRTRICAWHPQGHSPRFTDEQIKGPYALWIHEHTFAPKEGGTLCKDVVRYAHWGGPITEKLIVRPQLSEIFRFRTDKMQELFCKGAEACVRFV